MVHVQIWTQAETWIRTLPFRGPRKAKQEVKIKKPTFYSIVYTAYRVHIQASQTCCPPPPPPKKSGMPRPIDRALGNCDRMHDMSKQILALFQLKKVQKGRYSPQNVIKGERNGLFRKWPKRAKKGRAHLGKSYPWLSVISNKTSAPCKLSLRICGAALVDPRVKIQTK